MIAVIIFGTVKYSWYLTEIATVFIISSIVIGLVAGYSPNQLTEIMIEGAAGVTSGTLIISIARGITVILEQVNISDTIIYSLATPLKYMPTMVSGILMGIVHTIINFFITSGSGQAMATMPLTVPLSDI